MDKLKQFCKEEWAELAKTLPQVCFRLIYQKRCFADFVAEAGTTRFELSLFYSIIFYCFISLTCHMGDRCWVNAYFHLCIGASIVEYFL